LGGFLRAPIGRHIGFNVLWLLPFGQCAGTPFWRNQVLFAFMAVTAVAGALAHLVHPTNTRVAPMIGRFGFGWPARWRPRSALPLCRAASSRSAAATPTPREGARRFR